MRIPSHDHYARGAYICWAALGTHMILAQTNKLTAKYIALNFKPLHRVWR